MLTLLNPNSNLDYYVYVIAATWTVNCALTAQDQ